MIKQNAPIRNLQKSIGNVVSKVPISPNSWTVLSLIVAFLGAFVIAVYQNIAIGLILFAFAALLDALDGAVARARGEVSKSGGFLDGVVDRFVEAIFLFSFMFVPLPNILIDPKIWISGLIFLGTCMPSFIRSYADHKEVISKKEANALGGLFERSERLISITIGLGAGLILSMDWFVYALIGANILSGITIIQRLHQIGNRIK